MLQLPILVSLPTQLLILVHSRSQCTLQLSFLAVFHKCHFSSSTWRYLPGRLLEKSRVKVSGHSTQSVVCSYTRFVNLMSAKGTVKIAENSQSQSGTIQWRHLSYLSSYSGQLKAKSEYSLAFYVMHSPYLRHHASATKQNLSCACIHGQPELQQVTGTHAPAAIQMSYAT